MCKQCACCYFGRLLIPAWMSWNLPWVFNFAYIKVRTHQINEEGYFADFWVVRIKGPTQYSNVFRHCNARLVEGSVNDDSEDSVEVHDDFDGMAGFQAWLWMWNKWGLTTVSSTHLYRSHTHLLALPIWGDFILLWCIFLQPYRILMGIGNPKDSLGMPAIEMILIAFWIHTMAWIDHEIYVWPILSIS